MDLPAEAILPGIFPTSTGNRALPIPNWKIISSMVKLVAFWDASWSVQNLQQRLRQISRMEIRDVARVERHTGMPSY